MIRAIALMVRQRHPGYARSPKHVAPLVFEEVGHMVEDGGDVAIGHGGADGV